MNPNIIEMLVIGALNTIIQFLPMFIKNPNSNASARLRKYVGITIVELQQFQAAIPETQPALPAAKVPQATDHKTTG